MTKSIKLISFVVALISASANAAMPFSGISTTTSIFTSDADGPIISDGGSYDDQTDLFYSHSQTQNTIFGRNDLSQDGAFISSHATAGFIGFTSKAYANLLAVPPGYNYANNLTSPVRKAVVAFTAEFTLQQNQKINFAEQDNYGTFDLPFGEFNVSVNLSRNGVSVFSDSQFDNFAHSSSDRSFSTDLNLTAGNYTFSATTNWVDADGFSFLRNGGTAQMSLTPLSVAAVPEPSTFALAGVGLVAIGLIRRRRKV